MKNSRGGTAWRTSTCAAPERCHPCRAPKTCERPLVEWPGTHRAAWPEVASLPMPQEMVHSKDDSWRRGDNGGCRTGRDWLRKTSAGHARAGQGARHLQAGARYSASAEGDAPGIPRLNQPREVLIRSVSCTAHAVYCRRTIQHDCLQNSATSQPCEDHSCHMPHGLSHGCRHVPGLSGGL